MVAHFLSPAECNQQTPLVITFPRALFPPLSSLFGSLTLSFSHPLPLFPLIISHLPSSTKGTEWISARPGVIHHVHKINFIQQVDCEKKEEGGGGGERRGKRPLLLQAFLEALMTDAEYRGGIMIQVCDRCNIHREDLIRHEIDFIHILFSVPCTFFSCI